MEKEMKNRQEAMNEMEQELDLEQLEQVSGGALSSARKEQTKDINDDVASRF